MSTNWNKPDTSDDYTQILNLINAKADAAALQLDPATVTTTNLPENSIRWNSANDRWEKLSGGSWGVLTSTLNMNVDKLDGQDGAYYLAWANLTGKPTTFTPSAHNHDDRYYTETEADGRFGKFIDNNGNIVRLKAANGTVLSSVTVNYATNAGNASTVNNKQVNQNLRTTDSPTFAGLTVAGRTLASDRSKLDGIESGAQQNPTNTETLNAVKAVDGSGSGLDADLLDGQHGSYYRDLGNATGTAGLLVTNPTLLDGSDDLNSITNPGFYRWLTAPTNAPGTYMVMQVFNDGSQPIQLVFGSTGGRMQVRRRNSGTWAGWSTFWSEDNDGPGTGLNADLLDGYHASSFALKTNGTLTNPTFSGSITGATGRLFRKPQIYNTAGAFTYTKPAGVRYVVVKMVGGGGGGGGADADTNNDVGAAAGGMSGEEKHFFLDLNGISSATLTVGAAGGGAGAGLNNNPGSAGALSRWSDGTNTITCAGGPGGAGNSDDGGASSINTPSPVETTPIESPVFFHNPTQQGTPPAAVENFNSGWGYARGGSGGSTTIGTGGRYHSVWNVDSRAGFDAQGPGGGGSGGCAIGGNAANVGGGNGAPGGFIIYEYTE